MTDPRRKWLYAGAVVIVLAFILLARGVGGPKPTTVKYSALIYQYAPAHQVISATVDNNDGAITGEIKADGKTFNYTSNGPVPSNQPDMSGADQGRGRRAVLQPVELAAGRDPALPHLRRASSSSWSCGSDARRGPR